MKPSLVLLLCALPTWALATPASAAGESQRAELGHPKEVVTTVPIADPTRPPAGWGRPAAASGAASGVRTEAAPPQLASIRTGGSVPASAVISGQLVHVGERVDDATVTAIDPSGVTLRTTRGTVRLALAPEVIKSPTGTPSQPSLAGRKEAR